MVQSGFVPVPGDVTSFVLLTAGFPEAHSDIQRYRLLGNSVNVHVVSVLIQLLTMRPTQQQPQQQQETDEQGQFS